LRHGDEVVDARLEEGASRVGRAPLMSRALEST
jgi:hypothetical protein